MQLQPFINTADNFVKKYKTPALFVGLYLKVGENTAYFPIAYLTRAEIKKYPTNAAIKSLDVVRQMLI